MARYSGATWDPAGTDGGSYVGDEAKGVLHTTEGKSYAGARAAYRAANSWPHFTVSFEDGRFRAWQHIDTARAARALKNPAGGVQTNRSNAVQVEIVGTCNLVNRSSWGDQYVEHFPAGYLDGIAALMRWVEQTHGVSRRARTAWKAYPASYRANGIRAAAATWQGWSGWYGHQHVPENDHGDPGLIDIAALISAPSAPSSPLEEIMAALESVSAQAKTDLVEVLDRGLTAGLAVAGTAT